MSWHKSFDEYVNNQNNGQSSLNSGGNTTVTHNGKTYYSGNSNGSAFQSYVSSKKYPEDIAPVASRVITRATKKDEEEEEKKKKRKWYESELFDDGYQIGDVTKALLGVDDDTASLKDLTIGSIKRGYYNSIYGEESFKAMNGSQNQREEYKKLLESDEYQFTPGNDAAGAVSGAMEQVGQWARQWTNPRTVAFTGTAVGAAIIAGNAGPQALLPEEIISVPAVGAAAFKAASATSNAEIEAGHAYNEMIEAGISEETAKKIAWGVGLGNAGLDLIQLDELFDAYKVTKASGTTDTFAKKLFIEIAKRTGDVAMETAQEDAQELVTIAGVDAASLIDKGEHAFTQDEVNERLWETTKSSALSFGLLNAPAAVKNTVSIASEQKKANSLTKNEQAVVDKVVADRVAEAEKNGTKLSNSEKKQITQSVKEELKRGSLSIDSIVEAIGGEKYNQYKQAADWEDSLQKEYDTLNKEFEDLGQKESPNLKDQSRYAELKEMLPGLKKKLDNVKATSTVGQQRLQLVKSVFEMSKSDRLAESFYDIDRTKQKFDADLSKYDEKQRQHIQDAIDSGVLHNGNRAHEVVDYTAKVSADTGMNIRYSNTKKIKADGLYPKRTFDLHADGSTTEFDLGMKDLDEGFKPIVKVGSDEVSNYKVDFANGKITFDSAPTGNVSVTVEGTEVVDAVYTKDGIILNVESPKYLEALTGHEVSHSFEKEKNYNNLFKAVKSFAEAKGEWESRLAEKQERYKGIENANPEREVVADLIGEYLFQGSDFIMDLSVNHRNVFQKIFDEIKYLCKVATAGSKEARKLEAVKHEFEKIYRDAAAQKNTAESGVKYGISKTSKMDFNDQLGLIEKGKLNGSNSLYVGKPSDSLKSVGFSDNPFAMNQSDYRKSRREAGNNKHYSSHAVPYDFFENLPKHLSDAPMFIDNGEKVSVITDYGMKDTKGNDSFVIAGVWNNQQMESDTVNLVKSTYPLDDIAGRIQRAAEEGKLVIANKNKAEEMLATIGIQPAEVSHILSLAKETLSQQQENVKYSLSDSDGKQLTKEQQDYFKDSKVRDENGSLKVMYHGSPESFTVFDKKKAKASGLYGKGFYFSDSNSHAKQYGNTYEVYLNITNPLQNGTNDITEDQLRKFVEAIADDEDYGIENYGYEATVDSVTSNVFGKGDFAMLMDINVTCVGNMVETIELFNKVNGTDYNGIIAPTETVAFYPEQIKEVANQKPTADPDIRFSLSKPVEETKDLLAVHNLTSEQVLKSLDLGGLPMPSIAVLKADSVHDEYGEISLILPKESIDPKANKANKVYGGDAWTPVYPRIEYKPNAKVENKISDKYYGLASEIGYDAVRPMYNYVNDLERQLNNAGGEAAMLEKLYDDTDMMNLYLQDSGKGKVEPIQKETVTKITEVEAEMNQFFIDALGKDVIESVWIPKNVRPAEHRKAFMGQHKAAIEDAYKRYCMDEFNFTAEEAENVLVNTSERDLLTFVRNAARYIQNNGVTVKTEVDSQATNEAIRTAAADGYKAWVDDLFKGVEEKTGIRNNQDYYTSSGNPRSWDALHWANTLENVVKVMKGQEETGTGSMSPYNSFASLAHKRYGSISEIKADSNRLGKISQEEYEALGESFGNRFASIAESIKDPAESNPFIALDNAAETIVDAVRTQKTKAGILSYLQKWNSRATQQTVDDVIALVNDIANMPTGYFEAKPQRAVGFEEVGVFVIPNDADVKLKQELLNKGYSIAEYDPKVEGDRQRVVNQFEEFKFSLSDVGKEPDRSSYRATLGKDVALQTDDIAPTVSEMEMDAPVTADDMAALFQDDAVPEQAELEQLMYERDQLYSALEDAINVGTANDVGRLAEEYEALNTRIKALESVDAERTGSLTDADVPPEMDAPLSMKSEKYNPYGDTTLDEITRSTRTYSDMNPGARQYIEEAALGFLYDVNNSTRGERWYNDDLYYSTGGEQGFGGTARHTSDDIAYLKDSFGYTWEEIRKAAEDVVKGEARSAAAKRVEFLIHNRLMEGYTDIDGRRYEPNQDYITFLNEQFANENRAEGFNSLLENAGQYAPIVEETSVNTLKQATVDTMDAPVFESKDKNTVKGQTTMFEPEKPKTSGRVAKVLTEESKPRLKSGVGMKAVSALVDKGMVFENLSLDTGNMEVQAKWNSALSANTEKKAQYFMENGADGVKPLKDIINTVKKTGNEEAFADYMYHVHNIDRMSLEDRFDLPNKAVFGDTITAEVSRKKVQHYEKANPGFKAIAEEIYSNTKYLRGLLVENGLISQETADLWEREYPHFVPIRRVDQDGKNISVPLDTYKTGVNTPVKRATGGNSDIEPLFNSLAMYAEQTFSAIARNSFGIELKNTLGTTIDAQQNTSSVDNMIDLIEDQESHLLKPGTMHSNPTFTVFENGERVEFEITEDMYDALKPAGKLLGYRNNAITKVSNWRRNLLTTWNPVFALWRNPVKDLQDVMINSQHAAKTYAQIITPTKDNVIYQIASHGKWAEEYESNGGKGSTYFDSKNKKFAEDSTLKKIIGFPLNRLEAAGEFIEEIPRLAEYIASRKEGRSVDRSMLDAARVTTNFAAGGDVTKFANAHGFTFLNASVQGASQHVRNFREATKLDGMKGFVKTLAKYTLAGIPSIILNNMVWDDDEEYEELNDYVKQNYYVVAKTDEGKFIRIPKGRTAAVMSNALEQMQHLITGDDEADFGTFYELFMNNIAPNNPIENNIISPIMQVKDNRAWYGDDLVPSRLQDLPTEEQYDESTDALSKWLGENFDPFNLGPYKINYLMDQYSGGLGDMVLPMLTPEAESGDNTLVGNILAPWKKELTTDSVLNNKNPGSFYELKDELEVVANGKNATEEDKMRSMYLESVSWDMGELYAQKREIQNSNLPDDRKYEQVREIQEQINELANNALNQYNHVRINGAYAEAGDRRYDFNAEKGKWYEITPKNADGSDNWYYIQEQLSHDKLGMSYDDFWNGKEPPEGGAYYAEYNDKRYNYDAEKNQWYEIKSKNPDGSDNWYYQKEQEVTKGLGISYEEYWSKPKEYNYAYDKPGKYAIAQTVGGYDSYMEYYDALENWQSDNYISADKDKNGNSISGSRKNKVIEYINGLDLDYGERLILYRTVYSSKADKRAYNMEIINYLNERDDISYQQMKMILEELEMEVDSKGNITW